VALTVNGGDRIDVLPAPRCRLRRRRGRPADAGADHVLKRFSKRERTEIDVTLEQAADAVECIVTDGIDVAMNRCN
jgi:PTH1 family peptidyl-tRNA hydrolase